MDIFTIARFMFPFIGVAIFILFSRYLLVPRFIQQRALLAGLLAGVVNMAVDAAGFALKLWHYDIGHLVAGFPLDLYITAAIVYGAVVLIVYWWIRGHHQNWIVPFLLFLPLYGLGRDYLGTLVAGATFITWDNPYAWIADFFGWMAIFWIPIYVFNRLTTTK
ncbi:MAG TPA: hypothetical protein VGK02_00415 [Candidatus Aquicultor sp.]|jgi:hypothetical protein